MGDKTMMSISLPKDPDGRIGRECPSEKCSPAYFKVKNGTGIIENHKTAYCPYCRYESEPSNFATKEQIRYAKDVAVNKIHEDLDQALKDTLGRKRKLNGGLFSIEIRYKPGAKPFIRRPFEEILRRDVICPDCGLNHSVYGLATWCADCGNDIFLIHVEAELEVVRRMLSDIERRRDTLGVRIAAKDLENCLEDVVSTFEAVMKVLFKRYLVICHKPIADIDELFKKVGSKFQNIRFAEEFYREELQCPFLKEFSEEDANKLVSTFEKRHPITHNLGIVDRKYIERARIAEKEGKEIIVTSDEIEMAIAQLLKIFRFTHEFLFPKGN